MPHHLKRWSCSIDVFSGNGNINAAGAGGEGCRRGYFAHRPSTLGAAGMTTTDDGLSSITTTPTAPMFDPNDRQYRCCCGQSHATTGVRVIAGLLCATVLFEFWQLCWHLLSSPSSSSLSSQSFESSNSSAIFALPIDDADSLNEAASPVFGGICQLAFGLSIVASVFVALWRENSALLLPYLLLQAVGLGAVFIIFLALLYIVLDNDLDTIRSLVETYGPMKSVEEADDDEGYIFYMGWTLCLSCFCLLALQLWLLSIVFACWRYFRDKHSVFGLEPITSSAMVVLRRSVKNNKDEIDECHSILTPSVAAQLQLIGGPQLSRKFGGGSIGTASHFGERQHQRRKCRTMSANY